MVIGGSGDLRCRDAPCRENPAGARRTNGVDEAGASPLWIAGVDGCPAGWIAAFRDLAGCEAPRLRVVARFAEIVDAPEQPLIVAVDMPIGLPMRAGVGGRGPERLVRPLLGGRQSSVFSVPARCAVEAGDYRAACALALAHSGPSKKVSKQAFHIFPKIREIDALLRARPDLGARVHESHPEVAFWRMNGEAPLSEPKKVKSRVHPAGIDLRRALLRRAGLPEAFVMHPVPRGAALDDLIDALAMSVVAARILKGEAMSFPDPPESDEFGLPVCIRA
jgi:predicted RNase H-like nuclease